MPVLGCSNSQCKFNNCNGYCLSGVKGSDCVYYKPIDVASVHQKKDIDNFVASLYADGRTPSDRFGLTHEMLSELELKVEEWKDEHT